VAQLAAHLALENITLVLHDWGGPIGLGYAVRQPHTISRFVIFNTAASAARISAIPKRIQVCRPRLWGEAVVRGLNGFCRGGLMFATSQPDRFTASVRAGYLAPYHNWASRVAIYQFIKDIPLEADHPTRLTATEIEAGLSQFQDRPMLILWGVDDFCFTVRDFLPDWRTRFPQAKVQLLEQAGHYVVEDAHERIIPQMLEFLGSNQ
jgi:haloalkane dehalogenase